MKMKTLLASLLICGAFLGSGQAATIDFSGLPGSNGSAFNGPYVEDGFSVTRVGGQVFEGHIFGNPAPSLVVGNVFDGGTNGDISVTFGGSTFALESFDFYTQNGTGGYSVFGSLNGAPVFSLAATHSPQGPWFQIAGNAGVIDTLLFRLESFGTSVNLDNIVLNAAPVPGPLVGAGLPGLALAFGSFMLWYRRKRQVLAT